MELIIFPKLVISARKSFKFIYIERITPQKPPQKLLSAGTLYAWARTKIFWIWFICTLEGCVVIWTYLILKKVQIWNTLVPMQLAKGSQAVKLENHIAWVWTKGDWGRRKLVNGKWLELRLGKSGAAGREESVRDVNEIFGASLSRKGTLNSALVNL